MTWAGLDGELNDVVKRLERPYNPEKNKAIDRELVQDGPGRFTLWVLRESKDTGRRIIVCYMIENEGPRRFLVKSVEEESGPFRYHCPVRMLNITPERNHSWRVKVRRYHGVLVTT